MVPVDSRRVPRVPRYLGATRTYECIFIYGAVTLFGRTFQTVLLTPSCDSLPHETRLFQSPPRDVCGPATPRSPFESHGLGCSAFARHYLRNHGCFLFLQVLRWFTSLGLLRTAMYSPHDTWCSHQVGSPIRTSPDHRLCASPRSFSQLATSFIASLRLGIPTHALSSLTIKLISNTDPARGPFPRPHARLTRPPAV